MWNSGVIGLPSGRGLKVAQSTLRIMDEFQAQDPGFWTAEQAAFSHVLADVGPITRCDHIVDHYYGNKPAYVQSINHVLSELLIRGVDVSAAIEYVRQHPIHAPLMMRRRRWQQYAMRLIGLPPV